jgi:uncharacterized membrane protein YdbT with pleckstrin-like domain
MKALNVRSGGFRTHHYEHFFAMQHFSDSPFAAFLVYTLAMTVERTVIIDLLKSIYPFRHLNDSELDQVVNSVTPVEYRFGQTIHEQGEESYTLFIVMEGKVRLSRGSEEEVEEIATLDIGDQFGFEGLSTGSRRHFAASALEKCILLEFDGAEMQQFMQTIPNLRLGLNILRESYHLSSQVDLNWRSPGESIYFIARRSRLFLWLRFITPLLLLTLTVPLLAWLIRIFPSGGTFLGILLGVDILIMVGLLVWHYIDWSNDFSIITNQRVIYQERVILIYDSRQEAPLDAILSNQINTGQWGRWLGFGDVVVKTYSFSLALPDLSYPREIIALLEDQLTRVKVQSSQAEREQKRNVLEQRREAARKPSIQHLRPRPPSAPAQIKSGTIPNWLSYFLRMHIEKDGVLIYRTHWFILLRKIILPTFLLLLLGTLLVLRLTNVFTIVALGTMLTLLLFLIFIILLWWIYRYVDWANDLYIITEDQIIDIYKKPLGTEQRRTAQIKNILSVEFERIGFIGLIFNFGTVYIRVGEEEFTFDNVFNPSLVQREIFQRLAEKTRKERQSGRMTQWQDIADFFVLNEGITEDQIIQVETEEDENALYVEDLELADEEDEDDLE